MNIGIIGAGNIGGSLAAQLAALGHDVKLAASRGPEAIREQAEKIGVQPVTVPQAVLDVDVIILSIPFAKMPDLSAYFAHVPADVTVIDTSNYYPQRDGRIAEVDDGKPESIWASEQLGHPVIKTFNALLAHTLAENGAPRGSVDRIAIPVAGDDALGKAVAQKLVDAIGFDAVDAGSLADSWRQQPGTPAYCTELTADALREALPRADRYRAPLDRDTLMEEFMGPNSPTSHEQVVARNRTVTAPL